MTTGDGGGGQRMNQHPMASHGGQAPAQAPPHQPHPQNVPMPRQQSEEKSYDLQEMLKIWDSSNKSPFGEGTLV